MRESNGGRGHRGRAAPARMGEAGGGEEWRLGSGGFRLGFNKGLSLQFALCTASHKCNEIKKIYAKKNEMKFFFFLKTNVIRAEQNINQTEKIDRTYEIRSVSFDL